MSFDSSTPDAVARNILLPAAELGLLYRPIHLLVGKLPWRESVSPYTRDLTITLDQFVSSAPSLGLTLPAKPEEIDEQENWYYQVAQVFTQQAPQRLKERHQVEQTLGIHRLAASTSQSLWIDSKRIDWSATDTRISHLSPKLTKPYPVWFILNAQNFTDPEIMLLHIAQKLGSSLRSFTLCSALSEVNRTELQAQNGQSLFYWDHENPEDATDYDKAAQTLVRTILGERPTQKTPTPQARNTGPMFRIKA